MLDTTETNLKVLTIINTDDALLGLLDRLDIRRETLRDYRYRLTSFIVFVSSRSRFDHNVLIDYKRMLAKQDCSVATKNKMLTVAKRLTYLLLFQGLRQAEICNLRYYDVDLKQNCLHILGKGRDDKEPLTMQEDVRRTLKEYIEKNPNKYANSFLFTSERRKSQGGGLTTRGLAVIIKSIFDELDIDSSVHAFRHSFTTTLVKKLPNLLEVAQLTRHKSVEMLQVYNDELKIEEQTIKLNSAFNGLSKMLTV